MFHFGMTLLCFYMFNGLTVPLYYNVNAICSLRSRKQNDAICTRISNAYKNQLHMKNIFIFVSYCILNETNYSGLSIEQNE